MKHWAGYSRQARAHHSNRCKVMSAAARLIIWTTRRTQSPVVSPVEARTLQTQNAWRRHLQTQKKKACTHTWNNKSVIRNRPASSSSCGLIPQLLHSSHRHPNHILRCCHYRRNGHLPASPAWRTVKVVKVQCTRINSDRSSSTHKYSPRHVPHRQSFRLHIRT